MVNQPRSTRTLNEAILQLQEWSSRFFRSKDDSGRSTGRKYNCKIQLHPFALLQSRGAFASLQLHIVSRLLQLHILLAPLDSRTVLSFLLAGAALDYHCICIIGLQEVFLNHLSSISPPSFIRAHTGPRTLPISAIIPYKFCCQSAYLHPATGIVIASMIEGQIRGPLNQRATSAVSHEKQATAQFVLRAKTRLVAEPHLHTNPIPKLHNRARDSPDIYVRFRKSGPSSSRGRGGGGGRDEHGPRTTCSWAPPPGSLNQNHSEPFSTRVLAIISNQPAAFAHHRRLAVRLAMTNAGCASFRTGPHTVQSIDSLFRPIDGTEAVPRRVSNSHENRHDSRHRIAAISERELPGRTSLVVSVELNGVAPFA